MALSGDVKALIQANNGHVLAGTNNAARIYVSTNNGQSWTQVTALGSGSDSVNAIARDSVGNLFAAVSGSATASGVWRSTNHGASWTRVKTHPANTGYLDVTVVGGSGAVIAVGREVASASQSPITMGWNFGTHWRDVPFSHYYYPVKAVASHGPTNYQTPYSGDIDSQRKPYAFFGTDSFYTLGGRVGGFISQEFATATNSGAMGNGGLDMTAFLFTDSAGRRRQKALWAVKSHLNTANTEIWQWPANPNGPFVFTKIATITGKIFNVLYTDGNSDSTLHRTIWAGANGEIWVSYNSGLTWAVATTAPNGNIYSFVRTSSGVLIAGGASGEIFLFGGSGSEGGGSGGENNEDPPTEPENPVPGIATSRFLGRTATCEDEVYAANKFAFSNVTHIFHYNGSSYSNLQFANLPPYNLFGTAAAINKAAYFGSKTNDSNVPGGPFSSLVFDITTEARNITIVWEYWDGSSWTTLTTQDNTSGFQQLGVNSVNWEIPSNWTTTTVNSITGYWVRARISAVSSNSQTPIQDNRYIYTTLLPYIEVAASQISGDLPAIGRIFWRNQGKPTLERLICGLRSLSRGSNFNAYINISDTQTPFGLTITKSSTSGVAWQSSSKAPTGRFLSISYSDSNNLNNWNDLVTITLDNTVAREYYGNYRVFLRCYYNNASWRAWNLRLQVRFGSGGNKSISQTVYPTTLCNWEAVDFGQISIPTTQIAYNANNLGDQLNLVVQGYNTSTGTELNLYDLVLIPIDEWAIDTRIPEIITAGTPQVNVGNYLDIDSISNPKSRISVVNRNAATQIVSRYQTINNGPVMFQKNESQRVWFLGMSWENYWRSYPEIIGSVQAFKQQQYLGFRGKN